MKLNTEHPPTEIVPPLMTEISVRLTQNERLALEHLANREERSVSKLSPQAVAECSSTHEGRNETTYHARVLALVLALVLAPVSAGRKRVEVATWKWGHPQTITTLQRVPLPLQRVPLPRQRVEHAVMTFSEFLTTTQPHNSRRKTDETDHRSVPPNATDQVVRIQLDEVETREASPRGEQGTSESHDSAREVAPVR